MSKLKSISFLHAVAIRLLIVLSMIIISLWAFPQVDRRLLYKQLPSDSLYMEMYAPPGYEKASRLPAMVFFFGGGWNSGNIKQFRPHAAYFAKRGMVCFVVDYRVKTRHHSTPFESVMDAKSAIRYIRSHAEELHVDPSKIVASGGSAGGHLAAATALIADYNDPTDDISVSCKPNALVLFNPVIDNGPEGFGYGRIGADFSKFSPIHNIESGAPPTLFMLGSDDDLIPVSTGRRFQQLMEGAGGRCDLILYDGGNHGFFNANRNDGFFEQTLSDIDDFLYSLGLVERRKTNITAASKPNILWITIEDTSPGFLGCYGNKTASTPNIDRLAVDGIRFTNAFSTNTVCSPSRTSLITGVPTWKLGTGNHRSKYIPVPGFIRGFPYYLRQQGYYTTNNNKTDYNLADVEDFIQEAWNESSDQAGWWNRDNGQPFFAVFNYNDSHQSRTMTFPYEWYRQEVLQRLEPDERIPEEEIDVPPIYRDSPEMRKQLTRIYNSLKLTDNKIGDLLKRLQKDNLLDSTIIFFFADHGEGIPRGKTNGISLGYRVPFIIHFPPMYRHLSPWGTNVVSDELVSFEDLAPTLISLCGGDVPSYLRGRKLVGEDRSSPTDYLILASDRSDNGPDMVRTITDGRYLYSRNYMAYMPELRYINYMEVSDIKQEMRKDLANMQLNKLQRSLFYPRPAEFLFDTKLDPWETYNLVEINEYRQQLETMRSNLQKSLLQGIDIMFLPEYEISNLAEEQESPYLFRLNNANYPMKRILQAADLSGRRGAKVADQQTSLLTDTDRIVRYWAAVGLLCQSREMITTYREAISRAIGDPYPPVAITAAAIGWNCFSDPEAAAKLIHYAKGRNQYLALLSLNYMLYINDADRFTSTVETILGREQSTWKVIRGACNDFINSQVRK